MGSILNIRYTLYSVSGPTTCAIYWQGFVNLTPSASTILIYGISEIVTTSSCRANSGILEALNQ